MSSIKTLVRPAPVLFAAMLLLAAGAALPDGAEAGTGKGIRLGLASSKLAWEMEEGGVILSDDSDRAVGLVAGVFLSHAILPGLALEPELLYARKGGEWDVRVLDGGQFVGTGTIAYNLHYIDLPVLARISVPVLKTLVPSIILGPRVSWRIKGDAQTGGALPPPPPGSPESDLDWMEDTDYGLIAGLGFQVGMGPASASVDLRLDYGLSNLSKEGPAEIKNRSIMLLAGISF